MQLTVLSVMEVTQWFGLDVIVFIVMYKHLFSDVFGLLIFRLVAISTLFTVFLSSCFVSPTHFTHSFCGFCCNTTLRLLFKIILSIKCMQLSMYLFVCTMCIQSTSSLLMFVSASKIHRQQRDGRERRKHIVMVKRNSTWIHVCILSKSTDTFFCSFSLLFLSTWCTLLNHCPTVIFIRIHTDDDDGDEPFCECKCVSVVCVCVRALCCIVWFCIAFIGKFMWVISIFHCVYTICIVHFEHLDWTQNQK